MTLICGVSVSSHVYPSLNPNCMFVTIQITDTSDFQQAVNTNSTWPVGHLSWALFCHTAASSGINIHPHLDTLMWHTCTVLTDAVTYCTYTSKCIEIDKLVCLLYIHAHTLNRPFTYSFSYTVGNVHTPRHTVAPIHSHIHLYTTTQYTQKSWILCPHINHKCIHTLTSI